MKKSLLILVAFLALWSMNVVAGDSAKSIVSASSGTKGGSTSPSMSQKDQPFQAFGDLKLTGGDLVYTKEGVKQKIGGAVYTYDSNGKCIKSEQTIRNVDGVWSEYNGFKVKIPENAVIKEISVKTDDLKADSTYYIDPITGEKHFLKLRNEAYYDGELISDINCGLDESGIFREWSKAESVLDSQGRPIEVILWSTRNTQDPVSGKETWVLKPCNKYEYEYRADNLVTKTESYMRYDKDDNGTWVYWNRWTKGVSSDGADYYEDMWYNEDDTLWCGDYKYESVTTVKSFGTETLRKDWSWDSSKQDWTPSGINKAQYNNKGNRFYYEQYEYDDNYNKFCLSEKHGWEYQGDTLECGDWRIYYYDDGSGNYVPSYGEKKEYMNYTWAELNLSEDYFRYYSNPPKYEIRYELDVAGDGSTSWTPQNKTEYEYVVLDVVDSETPMFYVSDKKESYWDSNNQEWIATEYKYEYNDHGDEIKADTYQNGVLTERKIREYEYRTVDTEWYSYFDKYTVREEYWRTDGNNELVCWEIRENEYDENGNRILSAYRDGWDSSLGTWSYGYKTIEGYDQNGNDTLSASFSWNTEKKVWQGYSKTVRINDGAGKETYFYYNGRLDDNNETVWIPSSYIERVNDEFDNSLSQVSYYDWSQETDSWMSGEKEEDEYTATGVQTSHSEYYLSSGEWVGSYRYQNEFDKDGKLIQHSEYSYYTDWIVMSKIVYTYTSSGLEQDVFTYRSNNGQDLMLVEKSLAKFTGDRITEYVDSVYDATYDYDTYTTVWRWIPSSRRQLTYDDESGSVNVVYSEWDSYSESWQERSKTLERRDSKERIIYMESYYWGYDYYTGTEAWIGSSKEEYAYGPNGNIVMRANYSWDNDDSLWVGNYKSESDYDPVCKKETMSASYDWDYNKNDWRGDYEKRESAYDSSGRQIMSARYTWDYDKWTWAPLSKEEYELDDEGNRVGTISYGPSETTGGWTLYEKRVDYMSDDVSYYETYTWDAQKQAWRGQNKHDHSYKYNFDYEMSASYDWDEDEWCWVGEEKYERQYNENSYEMINYKWSKSTKQWVKDNKTIDEYESTDAYKKETVTKSIWNQTQSKWELDTRKSLLEAYRSDKNVDYQLMTVESYNGTGWSEDFNARMTLNYATLTKVEGYAAVDLDINVYDGVISVSANQDSIIRIVALSGVGVASGVGTVSANVAPGTYIVVVDGKTVKVQVR